MEIFEAQKFCMGFFGGVSFWSRDFLGVLLEPLGIFFGFWFLPPFDHPHYLNSGVCPPGKKPRVTSIKLARFSFKLPFICLCS